MPRPSGKKINEVLKNPPSPETGIWLAMLDLLAEKPIRTNLNDLHPHLRSVAEKIMALWLALQVQEKLDKEDYGHDDYMSAKELVKTCLKRIRHIESKTHVEKSNG